MGALGFDSLKAILKLRLGQRTQLDSIGGTDYHGVLINQAYKQLTASHRLPILEKSFYFPQMHTVTSPALTTTDGVPYITAPSDTLRVRHVFDKTNGRKLDWMPTSWYVSQTDRADTTAEAPPAKWNRDGNYIWLHPTPAGAYDMEVWYRKVAASLDGAQVTLIGAEWDPAIIALASYKGHIWLGEYDRAKPDKEEYIDIVTGLINVYSREETDRNEHFEVDDQYRYPNRT
jgi:hypothetical protein